MKETLFFKCFDGVKRAVQCEKDVFGLRRTQHEKLPLTLDDVTPLMRKKRARREKYERLKNVQPVED